MTPEIVERDTWQDHLYGLPACHKNLFKGLSAVHLKKGEEWRVITLSPSFLLPAIIISALHAAENPISALLSFSAQLVKFCGFVKGKPRQYSIRIVL